MYNKICGTNTDIVARLGRTKISVEELLQLKLGDVIPLDTEINGDIDLHVGGSRSFKCKPGIIKNKKGVVITNSIEKLKINHFPKLFLRLLLPINKSIFHMLSL